MAFPTTLDDLAEIAETDEQDDPGVEHDLVHNAVATAIEATQAKVGVDGSSVPTSLDYLIKSLSGGHHHDGADSRRVVHNLTLKPASDLPSTYPDGITVMSVTSGADGYPTGAGTVVTFRYSTTRATQLFIPFAATSALALRVATTGDAWTNFATFWSDLNDGPGSGMDADTVDGSHASDFAVSSHSHPAGDATTLDGYDSTDFVRFTQADELIQDNVGTMVTGNTETGITVTYDDVSGKLNFSVDSLDAESVQDIVGAMVSSNTETGGIAVTYDDSSGKLNFAIDPIDVESVQDIVGAMVSGNTENNIVVTYNDSAGVLNFNVNLLDVTSTTVGDVLLKLTAMSGQTGDLFQSIDSGAVVVLRIDKNGQLVLKRTANILNADLGNSEVGLWWNATTGDLAFKGKTSAGTVRNHLKVWTDLNDGAGSTLDADLLDGQEGTYFQARANHTGSQAISTVTNLQTTLDAKATDATRSASGKGFVNHGSTAGTARPTGYASVEWYGSVQPTNATTGDTWVDTA